MWKIIQTCDDIFSLKSLMPNSSDPTIRMNAVLSKLRTNDKWPLKRISKNEK